jgi:hypothetical protein
VAVVAAIAGVVGATAAVAGAVVNGINGANQAAAARTQADIAGDQVEISRGQLDLQKKNTQLSMETQITDYERSIADLEASKIQKEIDIRDAQTQIDSYDKWLANYSGQYAQETASKQAQTDQLKASGKESYENFLNAIGYSDAAAGATGRVGANTSQAKTTGMLDRQLVDYVGADRTLDANGGLYGSQLTAANMEMQQLKTDLEFQRQEMAGNRENALATIGDYQQSIALTNQSIAGSTAAKNALKGDLEAFVEQYLGDPEPAPEPLAGLSKIDLSSLKHLGNLGNIRIGH